MCAAGIPSLHLGEIEAFASTATAERRRRALAIYHLHVQVISRASGRAGERSAVACAAYRAGEKIRDQRIGQDFDYTRKQGVEETMILAPEGTPEWAKDRAQLWNQVESAEV